MNNLFDQIKALFDNQLYSNVVSLVSDQLLLIEYALPISEVTQLFIE